jgi:hypothetical protein
LRNIILYILLPFFSFSQQSAIKSQGISYNIINKNNTGFYFNYFYSDSESLLQQYFSLEDKKSLDRTFYDKANLNLISLDNKIGEIYTSDTIFYENNLNIEDIQNIVSYTLSNTYLRDFKKNSQGLYYFNVNCDITFYQNVPLNYKIFIKDKYLILECKQFQTFALSESEIPAFENTGLDFYNSKTIGIKKGTYVNVNGTSEIENKFRKNKAYNQLFFISILNDVRNKVKNYFSEYLYNISEQKKYHNLK